MTIGLCIFLHDEESSMRPFVDTLTSIVFICIDIKMNKEITINKKR